MDKKSIWKKIKLLWNTPKGRPAIKLLIWFVVMLLMVLIVSIGSHLSVNVPIPEEPTITMSDMQKELLKNNYEYKYEIIENENIITFEGKKINYNELGYKTENGIITKYLVSSDGNYNITGNEKILIDNLYANININYLDLNFIFSLINGIISNNKVSNQYTINSYTIDSGTINIYDDKTNIVKIEIQNEKQYILNFYRINLLSENDLK